MSTYNPGLQYTRGDGYGERWNSKRQRYEMHVGIDYLAPKGTDIYTAADGKVIYSKWIDGYGNTTIIEHTGENGEKFWTLYAHMLVEGRAVGTEVKSGDVVGFVGKSGDQSYPYHLHFEIITTDPIESGHFNLRPRDEDTRYDPDDFNNWPATGFYDYTTVPPNYAPGPFRPSQNIPFLEKLFSIFVSEVHAAEIVEPPRYGGSPIILDLDGDGVKTTGLNDGAYFDNDVNGFAEKTGWVSADDGLLVMDRNSDGIINDGIELFGDQTILQNGQHAANGFQALAELDTNSDGKVDANDTAFSQLKIWQDIDGDGYSASDELFTLNELGIQSINTSYTTSTYVDENGNEHRQVGSYTKTDSTVLTATDVWFQTDKTYTIANEWLDVSEPIAALPDLQGYGNVHDLHQVMSIDPFSGKSGQTTVPRFTRDALSDRGKSSLTKNCRRCIECNYIIGGEFF